MYKAVKGCKTLIIDAELSPALVRSIRAAGYKFEQNKE